MAFFFFPCTPLALIWVLQRKKNEKCTQGGGGESRIPQGGREKEALSPFSTSPFQSLPSMHPWGSLWDSLVVLVGEEAEFKLLVGFNY